MGWPSRLPYCMGEKKLSDQPLRKKPLVVLRNWSSKADSAAAVVATIVGRPRSVPLSLSGECYGHLAHEDGSYITTSSIEASTGRFVETRNTIYYLDGEPDEGFVSYLKEIKFPLDLDWPVKRREYQDAPPYQIEQELLDAIQEDLENTLNRLRNVDKLENQE